MTTEATALLIGDKIHLEFPYNLDTIDLVRDITGREWDRTLKVWKIPATAWHAEQVISRLSAFFYIDPAIKRLSRGQRIVPKLEFPEGLYEFQQEGIKFIIQKAGRGIIADDMGLGKTIEALAYIKMFGGKALIVAPANVLYKWRDEFEKWVPGRTVAVVKTGAEQLPDVDALIMSYSIMVAQYANLCRVPFDIGIWDEAHYLKNPKAQRTRLTKSIIQKGLPKVLFLSGTPYLNQPSELFSLLNMLDPIGFRDYWVYAKRYCGAQQIDGHWLVPKNTVSNVNELTKRLENYMLRRTKRDVALQLPELTRVYLPIEIPNSSQYHKATQDITEWLKSKGKTARNKTHILTKLNVLRQIIGEGKVDAAVELAENILESGGKVVLFAHHKDIIIKLEHKMRKYGVKLITGDTPSEERNINSHLFLMHNSGIRVIIMSVAGAEGIDLYSAADIIFVEREWTPAKEEQSEARLHRIGQHNPVTAHYIVALGTVDEKINKLIQEKRAVFGQVIHQDDVMELVIETLTGGTA